MLPSEGDAEQPVSLLSLVNVLLRRRWLIAVLTLAGLLLGAKSKAFSGRSYTSTTTFIPVASRAPSQLSGLAAQLGMGAQPGDPSQSPQFYVELLTTPTVLRPVVLEKFSVQTPTGIMSRNLVQWYGLDAKPAEQATSEAIRTLSQSLEVTTSFKTGIVTLRATDASPLIAQEILRRLLVQVSLFNEARRQQKAAAEREFTASQLAESDAQLRASERRMREFLELNREFRAPKLSLEQERLQRDVVMRQELYTATAQAYQQIKIEELRNAPIISIIEPPALPVVPNARGLAKATVLGALVGFMIGVLLAIVREYFLKTQIVRPDEGREFRALKRAFWADLRSPLSAFRRKKPRAAASS
ncbi:MAG TPA: Wzz/FepE/Etk N-terminal domain-containing protein [Gemmatimonadaceae bacterium]|nr:Wzz/FepE/Etk N-terminal domain-containing protein [Gemmatimonadaceae bacterium]